MLLKLRSDTVQLGYQAQIFACSLQQRSGTVPWGNCAGTYQAAHVMLLGRPLSCTCRPQPYELQSRQLKFHQDAHAEEHSIGLVSPLYILML